MDIWKPESSPFFIFWWSIRFGLINIITGPFLHEKDFKKVRIPALASVVSTRSEAGPCTSRLAIQAHLTRHHAFD
jgi:hypothetical protein